jgi:NADH:ubiquinone oxidoreductase subunit E
MARLSPENVQRASDLIALYPQPRSALIPILHVAQEQDGWLTPDAMAHVAELLDLAPAEVYGTASFYDMFFTHPVGRYLVSICTNLACTDDGQFTLEDVECIAYCGSAPCLAVNWRFFGPLTADDFDRLIDDLKAGRLDSEVPPHGTLCRVPRQAPAPK